MICPEHLSVCFLLKKAFQLTKPLLLSVQKIFTAQQPMHKSWLFYIRMVCLFACQQYYAVSLNIRFNGEK